MKSLERLLSTALMRWPRRVSAVLRAKALPSRELDSRPKPMKRNCRCLWGLPAVPLALPWSQREYSPACSPTPPEAACTSIRDPAVMRRCVIATCVVHHVVGSVDASSNVSDGGRGAIRRALTQAILASGAWPFTLSIAEPAVTLTEGPTTATTPQQSRPGGPGSPGYSPSTLRTSRKLSPTARTSIITSPSAAAVVAV
eukprot:2795773-Prymnesium_polylepis.1